mgnify:CR=1 FL=1
MRVAVLAAALLSLAAPAHAEWQLKPFLGLKFGGQTNLVADFDQAAGKRKTVIGASVAQIGEVLGAEIDLGYIGGYFTNTRRNVIASGVTTLTGNVVVALPRRMSEYTLRPYVVTGAGLLHASTTTTTPGVFDGSENWPVFNWGGGVTGFLGRSFGVSWELRQFRKIGGGAPAPGSTTDGQSERLSFWRANMALAIRY